jgi:hypothetical protein
MAPKCTGDWDSWVGVTFPPQRPANDGRLIIGEVQPNGRFRGKHRKHQEFDVDGECKQTPHHIQFKTSEGFTYSGKITPREFEGGTKDVAEGKRRSNQKDRTATDEDWVAVKVT